MQTGLGHVQYFQTCSVFLGGRRELKFANNGVNCVFSVKC